MRRAAQVAGGLIGVVLVGIAGVWLWSGSALEARMSQSFETHRVDLAVPTPLTEDEVAQLRAEREAELAATAPAAMDGLADAEADAGGEAAAPVDVLAGVDLDAIALERARERGEHLVKARYMCIECHGDDFTGGVMVDDPAMATWLGPNITSGGVTADYTVSDWDRIVRHGVKPDGTPTVMPSEDFLGMSDQELADIIAYIQSFPAADAPLVPLRFGPVGRMLVATGSVPLSAEQHHDHHAAHPVAPPETGDTVEFGGHLVKICTGCHGQDLAGGPIASGPPDWPPAANLTPSEDGLAGMSFEDFDQLMRSGQRPDGTPLLEPMSLLAPYASAMTPIEMRAIYTYLQSIEPLPNAG